MSGGNCSACPVTRFFFIVIHALSILLLSSSFSLVFFSLSFSLCLTLHQCLVAPLCWVDAIQRANVRERERSFSSFSSSLLSPSLNSLHFDFQSHVSLSTAMDSISKFMGLSEMYKQWGSLIFLSYFAFFHLESVIFLLCSECLYYRLGPHSHLYSLPSCACPDFLRLLLLL